MSWYPPEVYNINEDVTRENMRIYDERQTLIIKKSLEIEPNYYKLTFRERRAVRKKAEELI